MRCGVDGHALHKLDGGLLEVVEQDGGVGQDDALDRGVGYVALVPQRDVLERRLGVAAQHARETGDLLALDGVALVRHRRGPLLSGAEGLLGLAHLGALQVAKLGRQPLEAGAGERDRAEQLRVAVARDDLCGDVLAREPQAREHAQLEVGTRGRVGADGAGDRADVRLVEGELQALGVAVRLECEAGELDAERGRLGVDAVGAPDAQRERVLARARSERGDELARAGDENLAGRPQLQREAGVDDV